jgi:hypothetical protein
LIKGTHAAGAVLSSFFVLNPFHLLTVETEVHKEKEKKETNKIQYNYKSPNNYPGFHHPEVTASSPWCYCTPYRVGRTYPFRS